MSAENVRRQLEAAAKVAITDMSTYGIKSDVITESTSSHGVAVEGVKIEDKDVGLHAAGTLTIGTDNTNALTLVPATGVTGKLTLSGGLVFDTGTLSATGSVIADAANNAISKTFTLVSAADSTKCIGLPTAAAGAVYIVKNNANAALPVFPKVNSAINALSANSSIAMAAYTCAAFIGSSATQWYTMPLLPS
jgi:hypothetical protein